MQLHPDVRCAIWSEVNVLISGGNAEARRSAAQLIHHWTHPRGGQFLTVKDGGTGPQLRRVRALSEKSEPGTVFLEEVADLDDHMQRTLESLLQSAAEGIRFIATSSADLFERVQAAQFRSDLFYGLNTIHLVLDAGSLPIPQ